MTDRPLDLYLAQHYYSGPKSDAILKRYGKDGKKKKRKREKEADAVVIRDDDAVWFGEVSEDEEEGDTDAVVAGAVPAMATAPGGTSAGSRGWVPVRDKEEVVSVAATQASAPEPLSTAPLAVATSSSIPAELDASAEPAPPARITAGLMSGAQLRAQREAREASERALQEQEAQAEDAPPHHETVYRDAQGRRIDLEEEEARLRAEHEYNEQKKKEREQWGQGLVQRRERETKRSELAAMQREGVARYVLLLTQACHRYTDECDTTRAEPLERPREGLLDTPRRPARDAAAVPRPHPASQPVRDQAGVPVGRRRPWEWVRKQAVPYNEQLPAPTLRVPRYALLLTQRGLPKICRWRSVPLA